MIIFMEIFRIVKLLEQQCNAKEDEKPFPSFGINLLRDYILPLATFGMKSDRVDKIGFKANKAQSVVDNLVDSSVKVYKAAVKLMTPVQYLQILSGVLAEPPKDAGFAKRYKRLLLAIINGFPYTLVDVEESNSSQRESEEDDGETLEKAKSDKLIRVPEAQVKSLTESYRPLLQRLNERLCNFTAKKGESQTADYTLMAECTLGVAKLLERFPPSLSEQMKDKLIPSVCECMKSKEHRTRLLARNTLKSLMSVRTVFISFGRILNYLKANLKVGYQKHVLNNTVSVLLSTCKNRFKQNPSEVHVQSLLPLCETEFFGVMDEEKSVGKITEKTAEARAPNAQNILTICAEISVDPSDIMEMINCGLSQLKVKRSAKNLTQVKKWLDAIQTGICANDGIDVVEVLRMLQEKIDESASVSGEESTQNGRASVPLATTPKVSVNSMTIDVLPSKSIRDSLATENFLLLLFQFKFLYNSFRSFKEQYHIANVYYMSAVKNLNHSSLEIVLLSHRLVTLFLGWSQTNDTVPKCLLPGGNQFSKLFNSLVENVIKFCEAKGGQETVNVIFTSLTTFLSVHADTKLKKKDLELLLSTVKKFLEDGHVISSAMKFLTCVIELKPEHSYLEDTMGEILKTSTRSSQAHVIEACHKVTIKYLLTYVSSRKDSTDHFMNTIWSQIMGASAAYQSLNLLTLVEKIISSIPASSYSAFFNELPIRIFRIIRSDSLEISNKGLAIFDVFLKLPNTFERVVPLCISLLKKTESAGAGKQADPCDPFVLIYVIRTFNALIRSNIRSEEFVTKLRTLMLSLFENVEPTFQKVRKVAFQQMEMVITGYAKDKLWTQENVVAWKLDSIVELMVRKGLVDDSHIIRKPAVVVANNLLNVVLEVDRNEIVKRLESGDESAREVGVPLPFLRNVSDLKELIDGHFSVIKLSSPAELNQLEALIETNLNVLTQLMCHFSTSLLQSKKEGQTTLSGAFMASVKKLINQEVTQNATEFITRRLCYPLLKTYVHLADAKEIPYLSIGLPGYEKFKGPYEYEDDEKLRLTVIDNIKVILLLAIRDSTDANVDYDVRNKAETICTLLNRKLGPELFIPLESEVRKTLHDRRRENKAKKAQAAVNHPGLKRKRTAPSKSKAKGAKKNKSEFR